MKKNAMFHKLTALTLAGLLSVSVSGSALNVLAAGQTPSGIIDCCYDLGFLSKRNRPKAARKRRVGWKPRQ